MTNPVPTLLVAVADHAVVIKVNGRANFTTSVTFKRLVSELRQRGFCRFILDLSECVTMDSTFLGVLAGTALKLAEAPNPMASNGASDPTPGAAALKLLNPNQRVADLLDNLGISELFQTIRSDRLLDPAQLLSPAPESVMSRREISTTCLEAHRLLMDLHPDNIAKFKDVAQFLAEDLSKMPMESESPTGSRIDGQAAEAADGAPKNPAGSSH